MVEPPRWWRSLAGRLLAATLVGLVLALGGAALLLEQLFRQQVREQFAQALVVQLDQVTAHLSVDAQGRPQLDPQRLSDPRFARPYSGLYWQIQPADARGEPLLRSRSLWDARLDPPVDALADGGVHLHERPGPDGAPLLMAERTVRPSPPMPARGAETATAARWRLVVAVDLSPTELAVARFRRTLRLSLLGMGALLAAAAVAQLRIGLAPLRALQQAVARLHRGHDRRLQGRFPAELAPLVQDFNAVLDRNAAVVDRARTQAGNLAHAIKTPLAVMARAAEAAKPADPQAPNDLTQTVSDQVAVARRQVDWHLARAQAAASAGLPGARTAVAPVVDGLLRVMERVHADRGLRLQRTVTPADLHFAGEAQDLQEMLGNLIDNAAKWAARTVTVHAVSPAPAETPDRADPAATEPERRGPGWLCLSVSDDGPGIDAAQRERVRSRGARLDGTVPGSGLGLAIVDELVRLYGGSLRLHPAPGGGLQAVLRLPVAASAR